MRLYGPTHTSFANDILFRTTTTAQLRYDDSASTWDFSANDITTTGTVATGNTTVTGQSVINNATNSTGALIINGTGANQWGLEIGTNTAATESDIVLSSNAVIGVGTNLNVALGVTNNFKVYGGATSRYTGLAGATEVLSVDGDTGNVTATGSVVTQDEVRAEVINYASNQDAPYMVAATTSYTGATTNWGTYGFQHRLKSNGSGEARIATDTSTGEVYSMNEAGDAVFAGSVTSDTGLLAGAGASVGAVGTYAFLQVKDAFESTARAAGSWVK